MEHDIENLFGTSDKMNSYEKFLYFYKLLDNNESVFLEKLNGIEYSDILYSKYYWFLRLKKENELTNGVDVGFDQQADELGISIYEYSGIDFDMEVFAKLLKEVENLVYG